MRLADYIFSFLADRGIRHTFMVSGGGAMHLVDALGHEKRIQYICNHHEQACTMAAEGYARTTNRPGVALVTSGPGGGNTVTGVMGAWLDSIPMLVLSGQVKTETTILRAPGLRQLGDQEINITDIVRPITKYAVIVTQAEDIRYHLERALYLASNGRPGPVWLDIPLDVQAASIEPHSLRTYDPQEDQYALSTKELQAKVDMISQRLSRAKRPVLIVGNGVRLANAQEVFRKLTERLGIPVLTAISGIDLIPSDAPLFFGRPGILGERCANFIIQNADVLLILGTRLGIRQIGYNFSSFARCAYKVMVDIDVSELHKPTLNIDCPIHCDVGIFMQELLKQHDKPLSPKQEWLAYCNRIKKQYPVVLEEHRSITDYVSSYVFPEVLSEYLDGSEIIVTANGTIYTSTYQAIRLKEGNRMFANEGCASMGYGLPAAIGAAVASPNRSIICLTGDGSIQMNLQELQTIINHRLPIKIFMYNNQGYLSIKITQKSFFNSHFVGSTPQSGVQLPDMKKIAAAYGYPVETIENHDALRRKLPHILNMEGPVFCEIKTDPFEILGPKAATRQLSDGRLVSLPLEDLSPFLSRDEFIQNMIIEPIIENEESLTE